MQSKGAGEPAAARARATAAAADDARLDEGLMAAIRRGDASALAGLYDRHSRLVFALCARMLRDATEAEEVLQEVFWEVWRKADRYEAARGAPRAYLLKLARSRTLDRIRRRRRRDDLSARAGLEQGWLPGPGGGGVAPHAGPEGDAFAAEQRTAIGHALRTLPAEQRRAVMLSFFDGMSHREIAAALDAPLGTIKTRIRKGLLRLRDYLLSEYEEEIEP
ncbi:MAG: sigma-70 family RNA polymerase sigma factor [Deltaproteobacteria bacterium]|nr:sigma-70 family RNA polymerase sigma factor [Deltaproteobacteria bacterium]